MAYFLRDPVTLFQIIHSLPWCTVALELDELDQLIDASHSDVHELNVFQTILNLRKNRKFMLIISLTKISKYIGEKIFFSLKVMKAGQYKLLYSAISDYLTMIEEE